MQNHVDFVLQDTTRAPAANVSVLVKNYGGTAATLYGSNDRTQPPITNPLTTDGDGGFSYYAPNGRYTLEISGSNIVTKIIPDVLLFDPLEPDEWIVATGTGDAMLAAIALASYQNGQKIRVRAPGPNTIAAPLITVNGISGVVITKNSGLPLAVGEYVAGQELELTYNAATGKYEWTNHNGAGFTQSGVGDTPGLVQDQLRKTDVVSTIAVLKTKIAPTNPVVVIVLGYAAAGDGGGGVFWWNGADSTADDGGSIIQLNAGGAGRFNKLL